MKPLSKLLHGVALIALVLPTAASDKVSDQDLQSKYGGQVLTLRRQYWGPNLHFDATGLLAGSGEAGTWTVAGQVRVRDISVASGTLHILGQRLFLFYDPASKSLRDVGSLDKDDPARKLFRDKIDEWVAKTGKVEIEIATGEPEPAMSDVTKSMNAVLLAPDENLSDAAPAIWKRWVELQSTPANNAAKPKEGAKGAYRVGGGVSPPRVKYEPAPVYSEVARQAKYQGTAVLWLIIAADGSPEDIHIQRPLGMGLDEEAVGAVSTWKFDPATKEGQPVPVMINIEVNFRLY